jgi:2-iminoacetate synthase
LQRFRRLTGELDDAALENLAAESARVTRRHFGKTMRLFAPLYVTNECVNVCKYCGFSRNNTEILRVTLDPAEVEAEARHLAAEGFRHILLVSGEHPKYSHSGYLSECVRRVLPLAPSIGIEVQPMETPQYQPIVHAGAESLVVYQETYDRQVYAEMHESGPKRNFDWRLDSLERGYAAGFRRIQAGALLGLADWRFEALALAEHIEYLLKNCWRAFVSVSLPRLRPCAGEFQPLTRVSDRDFLQIICALRVTFPQIGITLSTRENPLLRESLVPLGITLMSAGSHTEPGGYTGQGATRLHHTVKGRQVEPRNQQGTAAAAAAADRATGQFQISDERSAARIAQMLLRKGFEPVWKDWDQTLAEAAAATSQNASSLAA